MSGINRLLCLTGKHSRSTRCVIREGGITRSVCRHCRVAMIRDDGDWRVATDAEVADTDESLRTVTG